MTERRPAHVANDANPDFGIVSFDDTLHAFLARSEKNTIRDGEVRVETLDSECDALTLTGMQTDVADIHHALGQQAPAR